MHCLNVYRRESSSSGSARGSEVIGLCETRSARSSFVNLADSVCQIDEYDRVPEEDAPIRCRHSSG